MNLIARTRQILGEDIIEFDWTSPEYSDKINIKLKKYNISRGNDKTWLLRKEAKLYKDVFGWLSVRWSISPINKEGKWVLYSELTFACASNGSLANKKFKEFVDLNIITGKDGNAFQNGYVKVIEIIPENNNDIIKLIETHQIDYDKAKKYWSDVQKQFNVTSTNPSGVQ
jgi:hypothetical protein